MIKNIIKYIYLTLGLVHYAFVNYLSYNVEPYKSHNPVALKIIFSILSFILLVIVYLLLIYPRIFGKKEIKTETKVAMYVGVLLVSLVSLAN